VRYRIGAWAQNGEEIFADWPHAQDTAERAAAAFFRKEPITPELLYISPSRAHTFTYHVDRFAPPQWARDAVIYQIFVDRFYPGNGKEWKQTSDLSGFCGGTLWGVRDKLDYIADLGANCIWLSPIFVSPSHHGYDALEYKRVETRLGGDEALRAIVEAAHERGIRVLLDLACNHLSNEHQIFQSAITDPNSPYRSWFTFDDSQVGYRSFFGVASLPQLNLANPETRAWMIDIARFWMREFNVDGFRLDYANGPGPDFWSDFWSACKSEKADSFCFGEVIDAPNEQRSYIGRLDGCLDFHLGEALRKTYGWRTQNQADFQRFLSRHQPYFTQNFLLPTFLDNHDMDRFLYIAKGDKEALKQAAAAQMQLSGPPIIYYGTEVGLNQSVGVADGKGLEVSRVPMLWGDEQDQDLLDFYKQIIHERRK
jgi:cyclomaltodextrinase / maltogenic alpha-amylase / neopullulanase